MTDIKKLFGICEGLYDLVKASTPCQHYGDQTICSQLRGSKAPKEVRGQPLPKEYWCGNCKNRVAAEKLIDEMRSMPSIRSIEELWQIIGQMHEKIGKLRDHLKCVTNKSQERKTLVGKLHKKLREFRSL